MKHLGWSIALLSTCALAQPLPMGTRPLYDDIRASVEGKIFRLTTPVGCVVWGDIPHNRKAWINQCGFRVDIVFCSVGHPKEDHNCNSPLYILTYNNASLDTYPSQPGKFAGIAGAVAPPAPKVNSVVACPGAHVTTVGSAFTSRIWQVQKAGGLLAGKCMTEVTEMVAAERVKVVEWPFYLQDNIYPNKVSIKILADDGSITEATPPTHRLGDGGTRDNPLRRARSIPVPDWSR